MSRTPRRDIHENASFRSQFLERLAKLTILPTPAYAMVNCLGQKECAPLLLLASNKYRFGRPRR